MKKNILSPHTANLPLLGVRFFIFISIVVLLSVTAHAKATASTLLPPHDNQAILHIYSIPAPFWQATQTVNDQKQRTQPTSKSEKIGRTVGIAVTLIPPDGAYYYGLQNTLGLPTTITSTVVSSVSAKPIPTTSYAPASQTKQQTAFATTILAGLDDNSAQIYAKKATFLEVVHITEEGANATIAIQGLFCSEKRCEPFRFTFAETALDFTIDYPPITQAPWAVDFAKSETIPLGVTDTKTPAQHIIYAENTSKPTLSSFQQADSSLTPQDQQDVSPFGQPTSSLAELTSNGVVQTPPLEKGTNNLAPQNVALNNTSSEPIASSTASASATASATGTNTTGISLAKNNGAENSEFILQHQLTPQAYLTHFEVRSVWHAIFFGIIAGALLNLMPCVLPVISLKFSALLAVTTMKDRAQQAKSFRRYCLLFSLGILTWFTFLAFMLGTAGWFWGEIFQNPVAIACMGLILFFLGLSMFNVYTLPVIDLKIGAKGNPDWQAFTGGLLATLLATPCSGPFLGGVIGWAIQQPVFVLITTILSVGLGMTIPYLAIIAFPNLINLLPKPGAWTLKFEQLIGFMLMAGVAYFMLLLPTQWHTGYVIILLAIAFAAWLWGQVGHLGASTQQRIIARSLAVILLICALFWAKSTTEKDFTWEDFSLETVTSLLGKEPMLLEFTADWCPNCKILEHTTLNDERMQRLQKEYNLRTIRVDLTHFDAAGFALLEELGSKSLPFIAIFPAGNNAHAPTILRDIITPKQLKDALKATLANNTNNTQ